MLGYIRDKVYWVKEQVYAILTFITTP